MKRIISRVVILAALVGATYAQDPDAKERHFLPSYWSKVVTKEQRSAIYAVQDTHRVAIERLKAQLKAAQAKQLEEMESVLTSDQKATIKRIADASKKASALVKEATKQPAKAESKAEPKS